MQKIKEVPRLNGVGHLCRHHFIIRRWTSAANIVSKSLAFSIFICRIFSRLFVLFVLSSINAAGNVWYQFNFNRQSRQKLFEHFFRCRVKRDTERENDREIENQSWKRTKRISERASDRASDWRMEGANKRQKVSELNSWKYQSLLLYTASKSLMTLIFIGPGAFSIIPFRSVVFSFIVHPLCHAAILFLSFSSLEQKHSFDFRVESMCSRLSLINPINHCCKTVDAVLFQFRSK